MTPMEKAWVILKRQTTLGEHHPDFPSPYGKVTQMHGTPSAELANEISRRGIVPQGNYKHHSAGMTKDIYGDLVDGMSGESKPLIWATGVGQKLPKEYAFRKVPFTQSIDQSQLFDEHGNLNPQGNVSFSSKKFDLEEGGMFGIRGGNIDWQRSGSPIYRVGDQFYIHDQPIPPEQLVRMPVSDWENYLQDYTPLDTERVKGGY